jgi:sirohydrochlorin ferrochelatase
MRSNGILVLGHGTPSEQGTQSFLDIVRLVESLAGETPVAAGFMEFAAPTIAEAMAVLHRRGVANVAAVPVFLSGAGHTAEDIPPAVMGLRESYPGLKIELTAHVGSHPKIVELSALRYQEALVGRPDLPPSEMLGVLVAHGSPEPEAFEELERFAAARQSLSPIARVVPCFSQMGSPLLKDVLPELARSLSENLSEKPSPPAPPPKGEGTMRIVVQPHFLLEGRLVDAIRNTTAPVAKQYPEIELVVAEPLGCHRLLAEAIFDLGKCPG